MLRFDAHTVDPKSTNGTLAGGTLVAKVNSDTKPTISVEYMFNRNLGVWVQAAWPFEHEIKLNGVKAGTTKQLPPTITLIGISFPIAWSKLRNSREAMR